MRKSDIFIAALWSAGIFGLMEGIVLSVCRAYPAILAPYKVSIDALWIAPIFDWALFSLAAAALLCVIRLGRKRLGSSGPLMLAYGFFIFLGIFAVISAPRIIHLLSAAILSLGLTVVLCRKIVEHQARLAVFLRVHMLWIPGLILMVGLSATGYKWAHEWRLSRQLPEAAGGAVNILVVVMDTVRYDRFTRSGAFSLTPSLNGIVANGVRFENAWSTTSWSLPSQASILTGRYPHEHGADWPGLELGRKFPTLGEFLAKRGYVTGAFSGNSSWVTPEYLGRGFLRFDAYILEDLFRRTAYGRPVGRLLWQIGYHYAGRGKQAATVNQEFLQFLDDYPDRPFFAYLCYMDVNQAFHRRQLNHPFWTADPPQDEVIKAYDEGLDKLDGQIGRLFNDLENRGVLKNTLVVITSDHGESFGAEGTDDHDPTGHGTSLYSEQTKVPLFLVYPGKIPGGRAVKANVSLRQIPKTITEILGMTDSPFTGEALPLAPEHKNGSENNPPAVLATLNYDSQRLQSLIWQSWQYINNVNRPENGEELYDLAQDPLARKNLTPSRSVAQQLTAILQRLLSAGS